MKFSNFNKKNVKIKSYQILDSILSIEIKCKNIFLSIVLHIITEIISLYHDA
jgi:hypothetical protein